MKKIISILLLAVMTAGTTIPAKAVTDTRKVDAKAVIDLIKEYKVQEGFEVVSVGGLGLGLVRMIAKASADCQEDREILDILDNLNKIIVVEYEDAGQSGRDSFNRKMEGILEGREKIMEIKDEGETLNLYGTSSDDGSSIEDIILYVPEDHTLICLFGSISSQKIADIVKM